MSRGQRIRLGVSPCFFHADPQRAVFKGKTLLYLEESMAHWLETGEALVYMLPSTRRTDGLKDLLQQMDGLVLQGGSDIAPGTYGETPLKPEWGGDAVRDAYEIALIRIAMELNKPVLGVCRGAQIINVALGGTMYQDIQTQQREAGVHRDWNVYDQLFHDIRFVPNSGLAQLYPGHTGGRVNTVHHQALKKLGRGLRVEAHSSEDGIIEAVRAEGPAYVFGVQWHPEFMDPKAPNLLASQPILNDFLRAIEQRR